MAPSFTQGVGVVAVEVAGLRVECGLPSLLGGGLVVVADT